MENAVRDLETMKGMGIEAVRTPLLQDTAFYAIADSMDIALYQDLPFEYLSRNELAQAVDSAKQLLDTALSLAAPYSSARHFGLMQQSDTSVPETCAFLEELISFAKSKYGNRNTFYYSTLFVEQETCAESADLVLLDARDASDLMSVHQAWHALHPERPMGFSAVGTWVRDTPGEDAENQGYLYAHSEEYQARYLEHNLGKILYSGLSTPPSVIFVYRWRDIRLSYPSPAHNLFQPYRHTYGVISSGNKARVSQHVVAGLYSGRQRVFAFDAGQPQPESAEWVILFVWINIFILSVAFAYFPRFRLMVRRYFTAHGFYLEAVREGRELLLGPNILLFAIFSSAFGICAITILDVFRATEFFSLLVRWAPESIRFTMVALLAQPFLLIVVLSGCYGLMISFWASALSAISTRSRFSLLPGQAFMVVIWTQWPLLLTMIAAGVIRTLSPPSLISFTLLFTLAFILVVLAATASALRDYWRACRINTPKAVLSILTNPVYLVLIAALYFCIKYSDKLFYITNLIAAT